MGNLPSPAFLFFKQTLSNPTEKNGTSFAPGLFAILSALACKAQNSGAASAPSLLSVVSVLSADMSIEVSVEF